MKSSTRRRVAAVLAAAAAVVATASAVAAHDGRRSTSSKAPVVSFADPEDPVGTSTVRRTSRGASMTLRTGDLHRREAVTVWWVVFNQPDACTPPACGPDDIFVDGDPNNPLDEARIEAADVVAAYATGRVARRDGRVAMAASLRENEAAGTREIIFGDGATLKDSRDAEIHLVVRSHGPAVPGRVREQIGSFAGGCDVFLVPPARPSAPGECGDVLFAVHQP